MRVLAHVCFGPVYFDSISTPFCILADACAKLLESLVKTFLHVMRFDDSCLVLFFPRGGISILFRKKANNFTKRVQTLFI